MRLNPLDAVWLALESRDTPMHVGTLAIFRQSRGVPVKQLAQTLREASDIAEPWNLRLVDSEIKSLAPRLVQDPGFDLDYHFRHSALPQPGGERELGVVVSRLHSQPLDRYRPLWEFHLIEGLERGRFAIYFKAHHALIDNVNAVPMFLASLASTAARRSVAPIWTIPLDRSRDLSAGLGMGDFLQALSDPRDVMASLRHVGSGLRRTLRQRDGEGSVLVPRGTPRSTLNRRINSQRRFATQQFSEERIVALAQQADSTVNSVLAYLCGTSLRRFFKEYNALPDESLVAALPVSLQERSELLPGNAIAGLRVALGTHIGDPLRRLEAVKASIAAVRADRASLPQSSVTPYVLLRSAPVYASQLPVVGSFVPPLFNLSVSNTLGSDKARYLQGARLEAIYPLNPLLQYSALSIDCVNYAGTLNIGFTGARDTLPHLQRLAVYTGKAVEELEALLAATGAAA
jgi:WS/DGAT/MGAT family acyltransferase